MSSTTISILVLLLVLFASTAQAQLSWPVRPWPTQIWTTTGHRTECQSCHFRTSPCAAGLKCWGTHRLPFKCISNSNKKASMAKCYGTPTATPVPTGLPQCSRCSWSARCAPGLQCWSDFQHPARCIDKKNMEASKKLCYPTTTRPVGLPECSRCSWRSRCATGLQCWSDKRHPARCIDKNNMTASKAKCYPTIVTDRRGKGECSPCRRSKDCGEHYKCWGKGSRYPKKCISKKNKAASKRKCYQVQVPAPTPVLWS